MTGQERLPQDKTNTKPATPTNLTRFPRTDGASTTGRQDKFVAQQAQKHIDKYGPQPRIKWGKPPFKISNLFRRIIGK